VLLWPEEEPAVQREQGREKAFIKFLLVVFLTDAVAVTGYLVLVYCCGRDRMAAFIPLLVTAIVTGGYFPYKKQGDHEKVT